ncbi:MAG: Nif3-like dinuclear metal center hexameric protein [Ruminococcaceae bacterium]|nr:Nif3-like dinuclear metal center hexameric protein [Oscillospiraceae bacterium]MBE6707217.1 Nif3-like dinuclear metal center hexameric protein [Oscillospiraceae bacterium]
MTVKELYASFSEKIPENLREEWDNDGIMCCADGTAEVYRALVALDVTEEIVDYAIERGFDLIVSHHPLIFKPLSSIDEENHISRKLIKLLCSGISVFSFHTRADKLVGGVNDRLADLFGMFDTRPFGEGDLGRIGTIDEPMELQDFAYRVKQLTGSDVVRYVDGYNDVYTVAVVGGDGKGYVKAAIEAGADTYVSGRIGYNVMEEASEMGINLIEAGHFFTEQHITEFFRELLIDFDPNIYVEIADSNLIKTIS